MNELTTVFQDDLVILRRNRAFTDSLKVAKGTKNTHHAIQQMIKKYEPALERWGNVEFSHSKCENPKGGRPVKVFFLNEPQATFLISLLDNNEIVVQFNLNWLTDSTRCASCSSKSNQMHGDRPV